MKASILKSLLFTASLLLGSLSASLGQLQSGLLNYWNFESNYNDAASTISGNASTVNDNGTAAGSGSSITTDGVAGRPGGNFLRCTRSATAGSQVWVSVPNSADNLMNNRNLTISGWIRVSAFAQNWQGMISQGEGSNYRIARRGGGNRMAYAGGTGDTPDTGPFVNDNAWHHIVATTERNVRTQLWVDGVMVAQTVNAATNIGAAPASALFIGGNPGADAGAALPGTHRQWGGDIDDLAMWDRVLTQSEIEQIRNAGVAGTSLAALLAPTDNDMDGLVDQWETAFGLDPTDNGLDPNNNGVTGNPRNGSAGDPDSDGLTNEQEETLTTNPVVADTDADGLNDGVEVNTHMTNPKVKDTDGDGLQDGYEVNTSMTSPTNVDTDGDTFKDGVEINILGSNPLSNTSPGSGPFTLQPKFTPIIPRNASYPNYKCGAAGWNVEMKRWGSGASAAAIDNYNRHLSAAVPLQIAAAVEPYLDHGPGGVLTNNLAFPGPPSPQDQFTFRGNAFITFTQPGTYTLRHASDDTIYAVLDTLDGRFIIQNVCCGAFNTTVTIEPGHEGTFPIDFVHSEGGGGDYAELAISGPGIAPGTFVPLGDTANGSPAVCTMVIDFGPDTDGDGLPDAWEALYSLDPNDNGTTSVNNGPAGDPDADNLTNLQEFGILTSPINRDTDNDGLWDGAEIAVGTETNPLDADTDDDGLSDGREVDDTGTNPKNPDTDGDGLNDFAEIETYGTNAFLSDSDSDGVGDAGEVAKGTDPAVANTGFGFGLTAYWPMDSDFNSAVGGFNTTSVGTAPITAQPGKFGNAVKLDGVNQYLRVEGNENAFDFAGQSMTISAWFTLDVRQPGWQALMGKGDGGNEWRIHMRDGTNRLSASAGAGDVPDHTTDVQVGTGFFHHVAVVSEKGVSERLYIDGVLVSTGGAPTLINNANAVRIGDNAGAPGRYWNGKIDEVAFWCRPLTADEIGQIYNAGTGATIEDLITPPGPIEFTQTQYNSLTDQWTLSWKSKPGRIYTLKYSTDLVDFPGEVDDNIISGGASTTFGPFANPVSPNGKRAFFKVIQN